MLSGPAQAGTDTAALRLTKVAKTYGRHRALIDITLTFRAGHVAAVLGPNGAGKSTMLGILSTLVPPSSGEITWNGHTIGRGSVLRSRIGYVGHEPGLYGDLTAHQNLQLFGRLYGLEDVDRRVEEMLSRVGLGDVRRAAPARTFSRGMQQRLSLARALLPQPEILLFDEPGSALDPAGAAWLTSVVGRERDEGRLVILVTHDLDAAAAVAEQVVILRRGRVGFDEPRARWSAQELRALYEERTRA